MDPHTQLDRLDKVVTSDESLREVQELFSKHFGLVSNPFSPSGIADVAGEGDPLRTADFEAIINFILNGYVTRNTQFMVVVGDYGTGKSHVLRFIERVVNTRMNRGDRAARAVYVERPRIEAHELNRTVLRSLGDDTVRKYVWYVIREHLQQELTSEQASVPLEALQQNLFQSMLGQQRGRKTTRVRSLWTEADPLLQQPFDEVFRSSELTLDYRIFLQNLESHGWDREQVRPYLVYLLIRAIGEDQPRTLAEAFVALLLAPTEASFASWESLLAITDSKALLPLRAPQFLQVLLRLMELNGIVYVYLLLDEFEEVPQGALLTARQRQDYLYTMREVFNRIQRGLSVVLAISPGGWDALSAIATPLADVSDSRITLQPLTIEDAIKLVDFYLRRQALPERTSTDDLSPLNRELIEFVLRNFPSGLQRTPRNLIQILHRLLNRAAERRVNELSLEFVAEFLRDSASFKAASAPRRRTSGG